MRLNRMGALFRTLPLLVVLGLTGCSTVLPVDLQVKLASNGSADDHMAAAVWYQSRISRLEADADRYQALASTISLHEDPKGFRRSALLTAAQEARSQAKQMEARYAEHVEQAQAMYGKNKQE